MITVEDEFKKAVECLSTITTPQSIDDDIASLGGANMVDIRNHRARIYRKVSCEESGDRGRIRLKKNEHVVKLINLRNLSWQFVQKKVRGRLETDRLLSPLTNK